MLAISTSWASGRGLAAGELLDSLESLALDGVEIDYRIDSGCFQHFKQLLKGSSLPIASLHNYCPCPGLVRGRPAGGDYFNLADTDKEERGLAVQWTVKTMEHANDLEAPVVVLHCGKVPVGSHDQRFKELLAAGKDELSQEMKVQLESGLEKRAEQAQAGLDALYFSIDQLLTAALRLDLILGIENRYYWFELPDFKEIGLILEKFRGGPLGYWHDMGHAYVQEKLGLVEPDSLLASYGSRLVGIHVHDALGLRDHLLPGAGEMDFSRLQDRLERKVPLVLELAPGTGLDEIRAGVDHLRDCLALPDSESGSAKAGFDSRVTVK